MLPARLPLSASAAVLRLLADAFFYEQPALDVTRPRSNHCQPSEPYSIALKPNRGERAQTNDALQEKRWYRLT